MVTSRFFKAGLVCAVVALFTPLLAAQVPVVSPGQVRITTTNAEVDSTVGAPLFATNLPLSWTLNAEVNPPVDGVDVNDFYFEIDNLGQLTVLQSLEPFGSNAKAQVNITLTVQAINETGPSDPEEVTVTVVDPACVPPDAPLNVSASDGALYAAVLVTWDHAPRAEEYQVYRATEEDLSDAEIVKTWSPDNFYLDTEDVISVETALGCTPISTSLTYIYFVRARNLCGEGPDSAQDEGFGGANPSDFAKDLFNISRLESSDVRTLPVRHASGLLDLGIVLGLAFAGHRLMRRRS